MWFKIPGSDNYVSKWHFHPGDEALRTLCGKVVPDKPIRKAHILPPNFGMCKACIKKRRKEVRKHGERKGQKQASKS